MAETDAQRRPAPVEPSPVAPLRSGRDLPHNVEAEQAVLGAILIEETAFDQVAPLIKAQDFYLLAHQHLYTACEELARESKAIDAVLVQQRLDAKGLVGAAVPLGLSFELAKGLGTAANVSHYARVVSDLARLRRVMLSAQRLVERGYESANDVHAFLEQAQQDIFNVAQGNNGDTIRHISDAVIRASENLEAVQKRAREGLSPITGVPSGIPRFDEMTLGLQPGTLVIIAARPSVGKTAFALNIATHAALRCERKVAFFSLEMPSDQLATRMLASEAKLDWRRLTQGHLSGHDWDKIAVHTDRLSRAHFWFDDNFVLTPIELRSKCRRLKREGGLDLVVIDYLQLMHSPSDRFSHSREQEIASISRSLKALASELKLPIMALSQLNRAVEKRKGDRPMLADLRESGAIEQDADIVAFLHRPEDDSKEGGQGPGEVQEVELVVAKQRQGPTGVVELVFFRNHTFFAERERRSV